MLNTTAREAAISPAPPARPRLLLQPDHCGPALLDGGWWPRSADPAAELPGLILNLDERHGRITRVMLGTTGWDASLPRRLQVTVPPHTSEQDARAAMEQAVQAGNRDHAPAILAALRAAASPLPAAGPGTS